MSTANVQGIHAQTPGVERVHQNRPQQAEADQRQMNTIVERAQDQKMMEAQEALDAQEAQIRLQEEQERQAQDRRKQKESGEEEEPEEEHRQIQPPRGQKRPGFGETIDITI